MSDSEQGDSSEFETRKGQEYAEVEDLGSRHSGRDSHN